MFLRLILIMIVISGSAEAQQLFHKICGTWSPDFGYSGKQVYDNGFIAAGSTGGGTVGNSDILLVRTDIDGNLKWQKAVGFTEVEQGYSIEVDTDSGFVIAGYTNSVGAGGYDVLLVKTDTAGNKLWHKTFGGTDWDLGYKLIVDAAGGFTIAGQSFSGGAGNGDGYLVHTDANGNMLWEKRFGGTEEDGFLSLRQTQDGGYVMCGHSKSFNPNGVNEMYVVRTNSTGTVIWEQTVGDTLEFLGKDVEENYDGGFIVVGEGKVHQDSSDVDASITRFNAAGTFLGKQLYAGNPGGNDMLNSLCKIDPFTFFSVGLTSWQGANDIWLVNINSSGTIFGTPRTCGDYSASGFGTRDDGNFVTKTNDNRYLVVGTTDGYVSGSNKNMFIAAFDSAGSTASSPQIYVNVKEQIKSSSFLIRNNGHQELSIDIPSSFKLKDLYLVNMHGQRLPVNIHRSGATYLFDMSELSSGIYFCVMTGADEIVTAKVIKP